MMNSGMRFKKGEIILVPFPFSDLSITNKKRPALIVSKKGFNDNNDDIICCLITSNQRPFPYEVDITNSDMESGRLNFDSKVKPQRLFTISKEIVIKSIGKLNEKKCSIVIESIVNIISN